MSNTSATGGALLPSDSTGTYGIAFEDFIQQIFVGVSGLPGALVRPRWQPKPPPIPAVTETWLAVGIVGGISDLNPYVGHDPTGDGSDTIENHEDVEIRVSCYGPNCYSFAALLRDGLNIRQNREALFLAGAALIASTRIVKTGDLVNTEWRERADLEVQIRRIVKRTYPVLNLLSAQGAFITDGPLPPAPFLVEQ
jgi:hypothetical protein